MPQIIRLLTDASAADWSPNTVHSILHNEKYAGDSLIKKTYTTDSFLFVRKNNRVGRDRYYVKNTHPAIVSREVFERAQTSMRLHHIDTTSGECGAKFMRRTTNGKILLGMQKHDISKKLCPAGRDPEPAIEQAFLRLQPRTNRGLFSRTQNPIAKRKGVMESRSSR